MNIISQSLFLVFTIIVFGCNLKNDNSNLVMSTYGSTKSHNVGEDCMRCHISGGDTGLEFSIAGSVYDSNLNIPYPNVTIVLFSDSDLSSIPLETLEVDSKGNFYSNIPIDWQNGLFASVSNNNNIRNMNSTIFEGSCNSCHGSSISNINIE